MKWKVIQWTIILGLVLLLSTGFYLFKTMRKIPQSYKEAGALSRAFASAFSASLSTLSAIQVDSIEKIVQAFLKHGDGDPAKLVYILATAWHESGLRPIEERRAAPGTSLYDIQNRYWPSGYYGRGFVQLTWESNYRKMGQYLGIDLVNNPERALESEIAAEILVYGMLKGMFTGKALMDYINSIRKDYRNARRIVNGLDRADRIAGYAVKLEGALPFKV